LVKRASKSKSKSKREHARASTWSSALATSRLPTVLFLACQLPSPCIRGSVPPASWLCPLRHPALLPPSSLLASAFHFHLPGETTVGLEGHAHHVVHRRRKRLSCAHEVWMQQGKRESGRVCRAGGSRGREGSESVGETSYVSTSSLVLRLGTDCLSRQTDCLSLI
jgi:hypothetical protein